MRSSFFPRLLNGPFGDPAFYVRLAHRREALLFDCGDLHALTPREGLKIAAVFISHAHIDHLIGFDALLRLFLYQDARLLIYGPPGMADRIEGRLSGYTWNLIEGYTLELTVREWSVAGGREVTFRAANAFRPEPERALPSGKDLLMESDHFRVRALPLDHGGITSLAFCLEEPLHVAIHKDALEARGYSPGPWLTRFKDRVRRGDPPGTTLEVPLQAGGEKHLSLGELQGSIAHLERGMRITYVTDASPTPRNLEKIAAFAADSHLLAIEAVFAHNELDRAWERNHLTARLAGATGRRARALRLLVFHHSPRYQETPDLLAAEAHAAFAGPD
jgi:ribonuclease Z